MHHRDTTLTLFLGSWDFGPAAHTWVPSLWTLGPHPRTCSFVVDEMNVYICLHRKFIIFWYCTPSNKAFIEMFRLNSPMCWRWLFSLYKESIIISCEYIWKSCFGCQLWKVVGICRQILGQTCTPPKKLTHPLKIDGWKMKFPMARFWGNMLIFQGVTVPHLDFYVSRTWRVKIRVKQKCSSCCVRVPANGQCPRLHPGIGTHPL